MLLVFILLFLIVAIITIEIKIYIYADNNSNKFVLKIYVFYVIPIAKIDLKKIQKKVKYKYNNKFKEKINYKDIKKAIKVIRKYGYINLEKFNLIAEVSTGDVAITSYIVAISSGIVGFIIRYLNFIIDKKNFKYKIKPIYENKKIFHFEFSCIISSTIVHITCILFRILHEWRCEQNGRKSSYRRANGYNHE
ncbi:MAG: DUF2953 domain-containing protein [Clostridia bacterium]|nr:DUF2953 domain-containing protein [Clostridia bacterium]